jgi:hypothetical protein
MCEKSRELLELVRQGRILARLKGNRVGSGEERQSKGASGIRGAVDPSLAKRGRLISYMEGREERKWPLLGLLGDQ